MKANEGSLTSEERRNCRRQEEKEGNRRKVEPCDTLVVSCLPKSPYRPTEVQLANLQVKEEIREAMMDPVPEIAKKIWNKVKGTKR
jgi:hypothetical protein